MPVVKLFLIDEDLANAILEYLSHRPYREVYKVMAAMSELNEIPAHKLNLLAEHITGRTETSSDRAEAELPDSPESARSES